MFLVGPVGSRGIGRHQQNGSGPPTLWPPPQNFPITSRPPEDTFRGRLDLCRKPEPHLTQTPYKVISSYRPKPIPPVICPNTYHSRQTQPLTPPHLKSSQVFPLGATFPACDFPGFTPSQGLEPRPRALLLKTCLDQLLPGLSISFHYQSD